MLKVICRAVWLCKLTYPVIYRLTLSKSDLHQTSTILNTYKQWPSISAIKTTIYEMTWSLSSMPTLHRSVQLKLNASECICKLNCQTQPKTNIGKCEKKRHKVMPIMQQTKRKNRIERDLLKGYKLRTNYLKNTTSHKSRPLNIQTKINIT